MFSYVAKKKYHTTYMLDSNKVGADEREVADLTECANNTRVVNSRDKNGQEVSQEGGLFLKVECQRLIVTTVDVSQWAVLRIQKLTSRHWRPAQSRP